MLSLQKHLRSHIIKSSGGSVEFMCDRGDCSKTFEKHYHLVRHLKMHDNSYESCFFCPWRGNSLNDHQTGHHYNRHLGIKNYICEICGSKLTKRSYLRLHYEKVHGQK